jgi:hypothetical protein
MHGKRFIRNDFYLNTRDERSKGRVSVVFHAREREMGYEWLAIAVKAGRCELGYDPSVEAAKRIGCTSESDPDHARPMDRWKSARAVEDELEHRDSVDGCVERADDSGHPFDRRFAEKREREMDVRRRNPGNARASLPQTRLESPERVTSGFGDIDAYEESIIHAFRASHEPPECRNTSSDPAASRTRVRLIA